MVGWGEMVVWLVGIWVWNVGMNWRGGDVLEKDGVGEGIDIVESECGGGGGMGGGSGKREGVGGGGEVGFLNGGDGGVKMGGLERDEEVRERWGGVVREMVGFVGVEVEDEGGGVVICERGGVDEIGVVGGEGLMRVFLEYVGEGDGIGLV